MIKTIQLTRDHINRGTPCHAMDCAAAIATKEQCPGLEFFSLDQNLLHHGEAGTRSIQLPLEVTEWIDMFDNQELLMNREDLPELSFELDLPGGVE